MDFERKLPGDRFEFRERRMERRHTDRRSSHGFLVSGDTLRAVQAPEADRAERGSEGRRSPPPRFYTAIGTVKVTRLPGIG
jgi:hypothetical protein